MNSDENDLPWYCQRFILALQLNTEYKNLLAAYKVFFRGNLIKMDLVSYDEEKPELAVRCKDHPEWTGAVVFDYIKKIQQQEETDRLHLRPYVLSRLMKKIMNEESFWMLPIQYGSYLTSGFEVNDRKGVAHRIDLLAFDYQLVVILVRGNEPERQIQERILAIQTLINENQQVFFNLVAVNNQYIDEETFSMRFLVINPFEDTRREQKIQSIEIEECYYCHASDSFLSEDDQANMLPHNDFGCFFDEDPDIASGERFSAIKFEDFQLDDDFVSFEQQIRTAYDVPNTQQAKLFFERAIALANKDLLNNAVADARCACVFLQFSEEKYRILYVVGFLCEMHIEMNAIDKASYYLNTGLKLLDKEDDLYEDDLSKFMEMKEIIDSERWKGDGHFL